MRIIAHRGYSSQAPENTLSAFAKALEFGVDGLEFDVQLSRDGQVVICHDEKVDRTINGQGWIKDFSWAELQQLDAGSWFSPEFSKETIPTLSQLLDLVQGSNVLLNVELKTGVVQYPDLENKVIDLLEKYNVIQQTIISSFNHYSLVKVKQIEPRVATGVLYMSGLYEPWIYAKRIGADALHPFYPSIVPEIVMGAKQAGIQLNPFTIDEPQYIAVAVQADVDGIITNYPERVRQVMNG